jgi:hypothetical protein
MLCGMPVLHKTWVTLLGWVLTLLGVAALLLPGPGLLLLLSGLVVLSQEYPWAERRVEPLKRKAFEVAAAGVETWPRILLSVASALGLVATGVVWGLEPTIPRVWVLGPQLPYSGWAAGSSLILSGLVALGLVGYSMRRFRRHGRAIHSAAPAPRLRP